MKWRIGKHCKNCLSLKENEEVSDAGHRMSVKCTCVELKGASFKTPTQCFDRHTYS